MRIVFVSLFDDFVGGGEHSLLELMAHLSPPWRPLLVVPAGGPLAEAAKAHGIEVVRLPMPKLGLASLPALWRWLAWLRTERPDLLHANNSRAAVYAGIAGRLLGIPMLFHCRIIERDRRLDWLIARLARRIVANSHATARRFAPHFAGKVETIYNGITMPPKAAAVARPPGIGNERIVLCVARVSRWKRHDLVLEAFARLTETVPGLHLVMLGGADPSDPAWMVALKRRSVAMACGERIHWLGQRDDVSGWYRIADALVLASRQEPFGRVVVEAMASGVPIVAANAGGPAEIIAHGVSGVLVDTDTPAAWADALRSVLTHDSFREGLIDQGRRRAADFSLDRHVQAVMRVYRDMLYAEGKDAD